MTQPKELPLSISITPEDQAKLHTLKEETEADEAAWRELNAILKLPDNAKPIMNGRSFRTSAQQHANKQAATRP